MGFVFSPTHSPHGYSHPITKQTGTTTTEDSSLNDAVIVVLVVVCIVLSLSGATWLARRYEVYQRLLETKNEFFHPPEGTNADVAKKVTDEEVELLQDADPKFVLRKW